MKPIKVLLIALSLLAMSCKKEDVKPKYDPLIGTWLSKSPFIQFEISDLSGNSRFNYSNSDSTLYVKHTTSETLTYKLRWVGKTELYLIDLKTNENLYFYKVQ